jgi:hypothetical protein
MLNFQKCRSCGHSQSGHGPKGECWLQGAISRPGQQLRESQERERGDICDRLVEMIDYDRIEKRAKLIAALVAEFDEKRVMAGIKRWERMGYLTVDKEGRLNWSGPRKLYKPADPWGGGRHG